MCDERERLIEYVYDECDPAERAEVARHVETCATCREEIAGLRQTRQDLLAWEVPDRGSVWRPFAPAHLRPWWREVPAWAMAAAAGIMFIIGVGGGVTAQALMRPAAVAPAALPAQADVKPATGADATVARAELDALEARFVALVKTSNEQMSRHVSAHAAETAGFVRASETDVVVNDQVTRISRDLGLVWNRLRELDARNRQLNSQVAQLAASLTAAGQPGR